MQVYFRLLTIFLLVFVSTEINAQVRAFDKLEILYGLFDNVPDLDNPDYEPPVVPDNGLVVEESVAMKKRRDEMVEYAKKQLGVPYVWAGTDPSGFDCSGFTTYVMKQFKKELPRRAERK